MIDPNQGSKQAIVSSHEIGLLPEPSALWIVPDNPPTKVFKPLLYYFELKDEKHEQFKAIKRNIKYANKVFITSIPSYEKKTEDANEVAIRNRAEDKGKSMF